MKVTIVGTGRMARGVASRALAGGHHVRFVGTDLAKAEDLADELSGLGPVEAGETVDGELVVLAVPFTEAPHALRRHAEAIAAQRAVVIDVTNPVDLAVLEPLDLAPMGSGAETLAAEVPDGASLVKAFNTTFAGPLMAGEVAGVPLDVFLAGDDADAKAKVARLAQDGGLRPIDAGALRRARELEATGFLHMAVQPRFGDLFATALNVLEPPR